MTKEQSDTLMNVFMWMILIVPTLAIVYKQYKQKKTVIQSLRDFNDVRGELETVIADVVAGIIPWLSGLLPAYMSYRHAVDVLGIPPTIAFILGVVVEGLAFANVSTFTEMWQFKREKDGVKKYEKGQVPLWTVIVTLGIYLFVVLTLNGVLGFIELVPLDLLYDSYTSGDSRALFVVVAPAMAITFANLLISLLTIPGAATISLRLQHRQYVSEKTATRPRVTQRQQPVQAKVKRPVEMNDDLDKMLEAINNMMSKNGKVNKTVLSKMLDISRPTVYSRMDDLAALRKIELHDGEVVRVL